MKIKGRLNGTAALRAVLDVVGPKAFREGARRGVTVAAQMVTKAIKAETPERTKSLKRAQGYKVKANKQKTGYYAVAGTRRDKKGTVVGGSGKRKAKFRRKVKHRGREMIVDPVKYDHLVTGGRRSVRTVKKKVLSDGATAFGRTARAVAPNPYKQRAWDATKTAAGAAVRQKIAEAAKRLRK